MKTQILGKNKNKWKLNCRIHKVTDHLVPLITSCKSIKLLHQEHWHSHLKTSTRKWQAQYKQMHIYVVLIKRYAVSANVSIAEMCPLSPSQAWFTNTKNQPISAEKIKRLKHVMRAPAVRHGCDRYMRQQSAKVKSRAGNQCQGDSPLVLVDCT